MENKKNMKRPPYNNDSYGSSSNSSLSLYTPIPSSTLTTTLIVNDKYTSWVRASWFPPSVKKDI
ncbi:hypothetical protein CU098_011742, partial [Rhizopus stolonifer]